MEKMTRGGTRPGAGRPEGTTKPDKKIMLSVKIDPELRAWLKLQKNQARTVEDALKLLREKMESEK
jgi:hypothetical protein